jgi:hypothetical protein
MIQYAEHCQMSGKSIKERKGYRTPYGPLAMALYHSNVPFTFLKIHSRAAVPSSSTLCLHPYVRAAGKKIEQYDSKWAVFL